MINNQPDPSVHALARRIRLIRGQKIMLDADLAELYGVSTGALNQAVKRNRNRFPEDFLFRLTAFEVASLRSHFVISKSRRGGRRSTPFAFTEHGAIMAATILNSPRAVHMSVFVVRAFVQLRDSISTHAALVAKLAELERKVSGHSAEIAALFTALRDLTAQPEPRRSGIGFTADLAAKSA